MIAGELVRAFHWLLSHDISIIWIYILQNIKLQDDFGFAPSTLLYHGTGTPVAKAKI
jgi:hypothetical protein